MTSLLPVHDPALVAVELHAAERAALVEVADRVRFELGLLGHRVFAEIFSAAGRSITEFVGAVVVPPGALVVGGAVEDLEMDTGMIEPDAAELHQIFRLQPDRQAAMVERHLAEIADPDAGHAEPMLVGIERADRFAEHLADAIAAVGARGDVGADPVMARIEADRMVRRGEPHALDAFFARGLEQIVAAEDVGLQDIIPGALDRIAAEM